MTSNDKDEQQSPTRGPEPERLKLEGDRTEATKKALQKRRPEDGWPDHESQEPAAYCNQCRLHLFGEHRPNLLRGLPSGTAVTCARCGPTVVDELGNCRGKCWCVEGHHVDPQQPLNATE